MAAPMDSVQKLDWAEKHFTALKSAIEGFTPYVTRIERDPDGSRYRVFAKTIACPPEWGLMIGDIANNARCALDYVAVQNSSLPPTDKGRNSLKFPIASTAKDFAGRSSNALAGVSPSVVAVIEKHQPYRFPPRSPLAMLQNISNDDKHHAIRMTAAAGIDGRLGVRGQLGTSQIGVPCWIEKCDALFINDTWFSVWGNIVREKETEIAQFGVGPSTRAEVSPVLTTEIHFATGQRGIEGAGVVRALRAILDCVKQVLTDLP